MTQDIRFFKRARSASRDEQAVWIRFVRMFKRNKTLRYIFIAILLLFVIFYTWATLSLEKLNEIGDAFNILNTFFTALAFIGLIITILLQRKDLALQREELKLQREEMQRQREEQKRQADEFEKQNQLMEIQRFESFFYSYLDKIMKLKKNVITLKIVCHNSNYPLIEGLSELLDCLFYDKHDKIVRSGIKGVLKIIKPYGDSLYILFQVIFNRKFEEDRENLYLNIIFTSFDKYERNFILFHGKFFKYDKIVEKLKSKNLLSINLKFNDILTSPVIDELRKDMDMERNSWLRR